MAAKRATRSRSYVNQEGHDRFFQTNYEGVIPNLQRRYRETTSDYIRSELERFMTSRPCPTCGGKRLRVEALAVTVLAQNIDTVSHFSITASLRWVERLAGVRDQDPGIRSQEAGDGSQETGVRERGTEEQMGGGAGEQYAIRNTQYAIRTTPSPPRLAPRNKSPRPRRSPSANTRSRARS